MPRSKIVLIVFIDSVDGMLDIWLEAVPPHELIPSQYELLAVNARDEVAVTQIFKHAFASLSELLWLVCKCDEVASECANRCPEHGDYHHVPKIFVRNMVSHDVPDKDFPEHGDSRCSEKKIYYTSIFLVSSSFLVFNRVGDAKRGQ